MFNEEDNIIPFIRRINKCLSSVDTNLIFIDDGSRDKTLKLLQKISYSNKNIHFLSFSRNFGHQVALRAGLDFTKKYDAVVSIDVDLQHPPELILDMIDLWHQGNKIVYTVRKDKESIFSFKFISSKLFYIILNLFTDYPIESGTADFRLLDKQVVNEISNFKESELFFRGLIPYLGFKQHSIEYTPNDRKIGQSKYTFKKMFKLAIIGITSFSEKPLFLSIYIGFTSIIFAFLYLIYVLSAKFIFNYAVPGWASIIAVIVFLSGAQMIMLGLFGIYLGKIFSEVKNRPHYIISEKNI